MRPGARRGLVLSVLLIAIAAPTGAQASSPYLAGTVSRGLATVLSPAKGKLVTADRIRIRIRLAPGTRSFHAWLDTTEITRSFKRVGAVQVAVIRAGNKSPLHVGVNHLWVRVRGPRGRRDFDSVRFVRARPQESLMELGGQYADLYTLQASQYGL